MPEWIINQQRDLGKRIGDLRAAAGYTQESFADAAGISRSHVQRIERGDTDARYSDLLRIAAVLDRDVSILTTDGPRPRPRARER
ncbi:helix-turn-helix domain-containing protein [Streptomyces griseoluteus]|uniref:helix-turn-helix domain-containing protein n=1 Tax=Streptomyces griseoluteus TaxID=29306 RepID=UPI003825E1ED